MKVLIINTYYAPEILGGAEYSVKKMAEAFRRINVDCSVFCTGKEDADTIVQGVPVFRRKARVVKRSNEEKNLSIIAKLISQKDRLINNKNKIIIESVFEKIQPDVIHTNGLYDISPIVWKIAQRKGIRVVHTVRDYSLVCPRVSLIKRNGDFCTHKNIICQIYGQINKHFSNYVDVVTAPSKCTLDIVRKNGLFLNCVSTVVPNAIDLDREFSFDDIKERNEFSIVYLGTLSKKKGVLWLLEAFSRIEENIIFHIAGKGELEETVKEFSRKDKRIIFHGFIDESKVKDLLLKSGVLICPSLWDEPFGRVVIDAYKYGLPVIASNIGALPEIIENNRTGYLVEINDSDSLIEKILNYKNNPQLLMQHSQNAYNKAEEYSVEAQVQSFLALYKECLEKQ